MTWTRAEATVEQSLLGVPVVLHRLVIVEMVASEVAEHCDRVLEFVTATKIHGLRRTLHHRGATANLDRLSQQPLHVWRFGRRAVGFESLLAETVLDSACHSDK